MMYSKYKAADKLDICYTTIFKYAKILSLGNKVGRCVLFSEAELNQIKEAVNYAKKPQIISIIDNTVTININGKTILIDKEDLPIFNRWTWQVSKKGWLTVTTNIKRKVVWYFFHRLIMNCPDNMEVDHINCNKLDNRKSNLRICTQAENSRNKKKSKNNTSGYKGVSFNKENKKWRAVIGIDGKTKYLGYYTTPQEAHAAYCKAAKKYYGEFANTG